MDTEQKLALVTGASKGIGAAIAQELARSGFAIWLNYRSDHTAAAAVRDKIENDGGRCRLLPFDVTDMHQTEQALRPLLEERVPYAVVNNAGITRDTLLAMMAEQQWNDVINSHLGGFFNVTRTVLAQMMRKRQGRIVNIVSTSGQTGVAGQTNYCAAKAGVIGATRALAVEVARRNILVNAVAPGFIATEMTAAIDEEQIAAKVPLGRAGSVEDVAWMVDYLCSEKARYITGQVFSVNGGVYMG